MILDNEKQKQDLISLLKIVPFQGTISQGIDQYIDMVKSLIVTIEKAEIEEKNK